MLSKSQVDILRKLEALLIVKQKEHEVDTVTIQDDEVPEGAIGKESPEISLPDKNLEVTKAQVVGKFSPSKYIRIKTKKIIDKSTPTGVGTYRYDPKTKSLVREIH